MKKLLPDELFRTCRGAIYRALITSVLSILFIAAIAEAQQKAEIIPLPAGAEGIGFDDLRFSAKLNRVLIPAGRTGSLDLLDPEKREITQISGFSSQEKYGGGHGEGITSVDEGNGLLLVIDRSSLKLHIIDPSSKKIIASANLASSPDYVRFVEPTHEIWVTEPDSDRIEVFSFSAKPPAATHSGFVEVPGGPESLVIDHERNRAYSNWWKDKTVAIDLKSKKTVAAWDNGCVGSRGLALDERAGVLFIGCSEGKAVAMDVAHDGKIISSVTSGSGVDIIDYNSIKKHLYFPGGKSSSMAIVDVSPNHTLKILTTVPTVEGAHCVTSDRKGNVYVCDPHHGSILIVRDDL